MRPSSILLCVFFCSLLPFSDIFAEGRRGLRKNISSDLMQSASQYTHSDRTPMGTFFADKVDYQPSADELDLLGNPDRDVPVSSDHPDMSYQSFQVNLYPSGEFPHPDDASQTALGDCNMLALLNSFAYQHPRFLKSRIRDQGDGVFEVDMFNPKAEPIIVRVGSNFLTLPNGSLAAAAGENNVPNWVSVLEKAIMKYNSVYKISKGNGPGGVEGFASEAGGPMLTGAGASFAFAPAALKGPEDLTRAIREALAAGKLITGGFRQVKEHNGDLSVVAHAYTIFNPKDEGTMISMRNPWGFSPTADHGGNPSNDGILDLPFDPEWFKLIDLRIIEPGMAGDKGNTEPYQAP